MSAHIHTEKPKKQKIMKERQGKRASERASKRVSGQAVSIVCCCVLFLFWYVFAKDHVL